VPRTAAREFGFGQRRGLARERRRSGRGVAALEPGSRPNAAAASTNTAIAFFTRRKLLSRPMLDFIPESTCRSKSDAKARSSAGSSGQRVPTRNAFRSEKVDGMSRFAEERGFPRARRRASAKV
jgi:hypothetical protein